MGLIRVILALSVIGAHYHIQPRLGFAGPVVAVKFFYIISGFYIALILQEKNYLSIKNFYISRYLRLYPIYIIFSLACAVGNFGNTVYGRNFISDDLPFFPSLIIFLSNILIIGQDILFFLGIDGETLKFVSNYNNSNPYPIYKYMYSPGGFSIAIEIIFYLIAPFLFYKKNYLVIILLIILSLLLRIYLISIGLKGDPWSSRLFFNEFAFFLLGGLGYNIYRDKIIYISNLFYRKLIFVIFIFILLFYCNFQNVEIIEGTYIFLNDIFMFVFFTIFIGIFFDLFKNNRNDRILGEISYPIYCSHIVIIGITKVFGIMSEISYVNTVILFITTMIVSYFAYIIIQKPVDELRSKLKY